MGDEHGTFRQRQWREAHERAEQNRSADLFGWWIDMRFKGRIETRTADISMTDELRLYNAQQVARLLYAYE